MKKLICLRYAVLLVMPVLLAFDGGCSSEASLAHHKNAAAMVQLLSESDNNRTIGMRIGETLRVTLPENATTGFRWEIDRCDRAVVGVVAEEPHYNGATVVGSGGHVEFVFQGRKAGSSEIVLKHWRAWEGEASVIARFRLHVNVLP